MHLVELGEAMDNDEHFCGAEGGGKMALASPSRLSSPASPSVLASDLGEQTNSVKEKVIGKFSFKDRIFICCQLSCPFVLLL